MNKLISIYINNGVSLFEQGENTVIIPIELSNDIIDILENLNFFILGGDLYIKNNNKFEHNKRSLVDLCYFVNVLSFSVDCFLVHARSSG